MSSCTDRRFEDLLYAYELGMLTDEERHDLELHAMNCSSCLESLKGFSDTIETLRTDPDTRQTIENLAGAAKNDSPEKTTSTETAPRGWRRLVVVYAAAAAVLLLLILKDWQFELRPSHEAVAMENRLVVMNFDNLTDPDDSENLARVLTSLLITDLSESAYLKVVSNERLHDILKLIDRDGHVSSQQDIATEVARYARARWILTGEIVQSEPVLTVTASVIDVTSGDIVTSEKVIATADESVFGFADRLSAAVKNDLSLPAEAASEPDRMVSEVTTNSPEAYRYFVEAVDNYYKYYWNEAQAAFYGALEFDSTFAMAYYYLSALETGQKRRDMIDLALKYSHQAGRRKSYYIRSLHKAINDDVDAAMTELRSLITDYPDEGHAHYLLGSYLYYRRQHDDALSHFRQAIAIDPLDKTTYNALALVYDVIGDYEKSIWAIDKYIKLAPDEANSYSTRALIYARNGNIEKAIESWKTALEIKPDFHTALSYLGDMYLFKREFATADSLFYIFDTLKTNQQRSSGIYYRAQTQVHQGRFDSALAILDEGIRFDFETELPRGGVHKWFARAFILHALGRTDEAIATLDSAMTKTRQASTLDDNLRAAKIQMLAANGNIKMADSLLTELLVSCRVSVDQCYAYQYAAGCLNFSTGNYDDAIRHFRAAMDEITTRDAARHFMGHTMLARAYLESGRLAEAVKELENQLSIYTSYRASMGVWSVKLHYYLGTAYEQSRWYDKAAEQYTIFLETWENADSGIWELEDAATRLAQLKQSP